MKKTVFSLMVVCTLLLPSCGKKDSKDNNPDDNPSTTTGYENYNFYISAYGCEMVSFLKDFKEALAATKSTLNFTIVGNNVYTFGAKKYRTGGRIVSHDYSGTLAKNNIPVYDNIGGDAASIVGVQEYGGSVYFNTTFASQEGAVSVYDAYCIPKIWKDGNLIYILNGPYSNTVTVNGVRQTSKGFGVSTGGLIVKNGDIYVGGVCQDYDSGEKSFGYWKNGIYNELIKSDRISLDYKLMVSEAGDVYYYCATGDGHNYLFKNGVNTLNAGAADMGFINFTILNNDVYIIGNKYESGGNYLKIYKNNVVQYSSPSNDSYFPSPAIYAFDNKIFIAGEDVKTYSNFTNVYEFNPDSKSLIKIDANSYDFQGCSHITIVNFEVTKK